VNAARVELRAVSLAFGAKTVLRDFTAEFAPGVHLLVGPNGSGKTTLLNLVAGVLRPDRGEVVVCGETAKAAAARSFLVPDESPAMPWLRADEFLEFAGGLYPPRADAPKRADVVGRFGLQPFLASRFAELSSGTSRKVVIAAALLSAPEVLLFDEPTNELDAASVAAFVEMLARLSDRVALVATHQPEHFERVATVRTAISLP
jgi:ABC-2 type transport system ATP-binding protein